MSNITTNVSLTNDAKDPVGAYLVDPNGNVGGYGQNSINGTQTTSLTAYSVNPIQGTWTLVVDFAEPVAGDEISQAFTGNILFNNVKVTAQGMPNSAATTLPAGQPVTVPVTITNNGVSSTGTSPSGSYTPPAGNLNNGFWFAAPSEIGPYPSSAPAGTVSMSMSVTFKAFDPAVTSDTGDLELASTNPSTTFSPVVINPGQSATVHVTITPSGSPGSVVTGTLYVDDFMTNVPPYGQQGASELAAIPYTYTIG